MSTKKEIFTAWRSMGFSCRNSIDPSLARTFLEKIGLELPEKMIYTENRYRETSNGKPRIDCEDLLIFACSQNGIQADKRIMAASDKMFGEGSRRDLVEEAYFKGMEEN